MPSDAQQGSQPGAPAGSQATKDATTPAKPSGEAGSGAGEPSPPKTADPPATAASTDKAASQTAPPKTSTPAPIEAKDHPTLRYLAGDDTTKDKTKDQAKPDAKAKPEAAAKPADDKAAKGAAADPDELPADPKQRNQKFAEMRTKVRDLEAEQVKLKEQAVTLKEHADFGAEMAGILTKPEVIEDFQLVNNDQLQGVVKIQAALNRVEHLVANGGQATAADRAVIEQAVQRLSATAAKAGIQIGGSAIEPIKGDLPQRWADLVAIGEVTEADARLYAGLDASRAAKGKAPAAAAPAVPAVPAARAVPEQQKPPAQRAAPSAADPLQADRELYRGMSRKILVSDGFATDDAIKAHYRDNLLPVILADYVAPNLPAGKDPIDVFLKLTPQAQHDLVVRSQTAWKAKQQANQRPAGSEEGKPGPKQPTPIFRRNFGPRRGLPNNLQAGSPEERKAQAQTTLDYLAGKSDG